MSQILDASPFHASRPMPWTLGDSFETMRQLLTLQLTKGSGGGGGWVDEPTHKALRESFEKTI